MAMLRSAALRQLAPAARFLCNGGRGSSGSSVTARRKLFSGCGDAFKGSESGKSSAEFSDENFTWKKPEAWFAGIATRRSEYV